MVSHICVSDHAEAGDLIFFLGNAVTHGSEGAVGEAVIFADVPSHETPTKGRGGVQQNDSLADGYPKGGARPMSGGRCSAAT